jgi:hypothetical protein
MATGLPSSAQEPASAPIELWSGFTTASTSGQIKTFKATQPRHRVEVFPGCVAEMTYRFKSGQLVSIIFLGQDREADCFARMFADLKSRFGQPETDTTTFGGGFAYGTASGVTMVTNSSTGIVYVWRDGEKKTKIVKSPGNGYNLIFTVRPDKFIH